VDLVLWLLKIGIQIQEREKLLFINMIIAYSIIGIKVSTRNCLNWLSHKSNFIILKHKMDKKVREGFGRKRRMSLTKARGKKNKL
jgi:hypothetical protein